jgi:hypothetical protein
MAKIPSEYFSREPEEKQENFQSVSLTSYPEWNLTFSEDNREC